MDKPFERLWRCYEAAAEVEDAARRSAVEAAWEMRRHLLAAGMEKEWRQLFNEVIGLNIPAAVAVKEEVRLKLVEAGVERERLPHPVGVG